MILVAHSLVPSSPLPYLHLGYLSAFANETTDRVPGFAFFVGGGVMLSVVGLLLAKRFGRTSLRWRRFGFAAFFFGMLTVILSSAIPVPPRYLHPEKATRDHIENPQRLLNYMVVAGDPMPTDVSSIAPSIGYLCDGWGRPLHIEKRLYAGFLESVVVSAGPDGRFGTADDITGNPLSKADLSGERVSALCFIIRDQFFNRLYHKLDTQALGKDAGLNAVQLQDGWGHTLRITENIGNTGHMDKEQPSYLVTSAGPDGKFGTADDINRSTR